MIKFPSLQELKELQSFKEPFCLTVYVPLLDANVTTNPNRIELKNLLREAEKALLSAGVKPLDIKKTLKPARSLVADHKFWPIRRESLVLFLHPKLFRFYHIPDHATPYQLTVETGFNVEPLLHVMKDNQQYYVLALGHKNVQLFKGDHYSIKRIRLKNFPSDMKKVLNIDEYPNWFEKHKIAPSYMGKGSEAFHGQYNVSQTDKDMLLKFFRRIDRRLHKFLTQRHKPLVIAGVNYLLPIYRKVNTYPELLSGTITGNQDNVDLQTLKDKAWSIVNQGI